MKRSDETGIIMTPQIGLHKLTNIIFITITHNPGQNIWNKIEKSKKIGQDKKSLISTFACFLTAIAKV